MFLIARRKDAAQVLLETDPGFFGGAGRVGIDSAQKILDFLLNLPCDNFYLRAARRSLPWLDLVLHLRLHSLPIPKQTSFDLARTGDPLVCTNTWGADKFQLGGKDQTYPGLLAR
jgi:hypothetical protein